jgi:16S rRNA (cytidine1402-2'-O)-methyltransferase
MVFFESVHRVADTLSALLEQFGSARRAAIARELTKVHDSVYTGSLEELRARLGVSIPLLGEFVIVVAGSSAQAEPAADEIRRVFALLCADLGADRAVTLTAAITGAARNAVYQLTRVRADAEQAE